MDRTGADYFAAIESMKERLGANAHPIFLPIGAEEEFKGLIDLASMQALIYDTTDESGMTFEVTDIPSDMIDQANEYHEKLIEALADFDDDLAEKYLEGQDLTADDIRSRSAQRRSRLISAACFPGVPSRIRACNPCSNRS